MDHLVVSHVLKSIHRGSGGVVRTLKLFLLLWLTLTTVRAQNRCPKFCDCIPTVVRCINIRLERIPIEDIPIDTLQLDLRYNLITELRKKDFDKLVNLEHLYLGNNLISSIGQFTFSSIKNLKDLYLLGNKIKEIKEDAFKGLDTLKHLYLQNNQIHNITNTVFKDLSSLTRLYLHNNRLTTITKEFLSPLKSLRILRLSSNQVKCSCVFLRMIKELSFENEVTVAATCEFNGRQRHTTALKYSDVGCYRPKFLTEPSKQVGIPGIRIIVDCEADGSPPPDVTWLKDGKPLSSELHHKIHDNGSLSIFKFSKEAVGYYQCIISNVMGRQSAGATLQLVEENMAPIFTELPKDSTAVVDNIALFNCRATGYPRPQIKWLKSGQLLTQNEKYRLLTNGDLEIKSLTLSDSVSFTCRAENDLGSVSHTSKLIVQAPPKFIATPKHINMVAGGSIQFDCTATGSPTPAISWQKDGERLPSDGRHIVLPSGALRVLYLVEQNEGVYECQAINIVGVVAARANLTVESLSLPEIMEKPSDTTAQSGNTIKFTCSSQGSPTPVVTWMRNGVQVTSGSRFVVDNVEGTIEIKDVGKVDEGRWECHARNTVGDVKETFTLNVIQSEKGYKGDRFVLESFEQARSEVDRAIELTKRKLENFKPRSPSDLLALFRFPSADALKIARSAEIFEAAIELIQKNVDSGLMLKEMKHRYKFNGLVSPEHIRLIANLSGCTAHQRLVNCSDLCFHKKYRTYDGSCNNFRHPMWGASLTPFSRLLIPSYENGFNTPLGWNKTKLPSARQISLKLISTAHVTSDADYTHMLMQWGQFLDHDIDFTVTSPSSSRFNDGKSCKETCENEQPCFPIEIPKDDPRIKRYKCMQFTRSSAVCGSGSTSLFFDSITPRQQINQITSFIDASNVYGSSAKDALDLRTEDTNEHDDKGLLREGMLQKNGKYLLPFNKDTSIECQVNKSESSVPCFLAGDHRANEQLGLLSMHTLWMRQHNRIARQLARFNPHWIGEKIYQETRKVVGAQMQHITYNEWLPKILGKKGIEKLGTYKGYNPNVDPTIFNAFATAAFRFGHTLIQPILARLNSSFQEIAEGSLPLHKAFFSPYRLIEEGGVDPLLRGLFGTPVKSRDATHQLLNSELTEHLFEMAHTVALDLAALNIQRGRDHGLPYYNSWRQFCNMTVAKDFDEFVEIENEDLREKLRTIYGNVDEVDVFVGGLLEDPLPGSRLGPTFMCLISRQFDRLRSGDRFWYENPSVFTDDQLLQIKQTTLARVICDNSDDIRHVQHDVFRRAHGVSDYIPCFQHSEVDLRFWKECCSAEGACVSSDQTPTVSNSVRENLRLQRVSRHTLRSRRSVIGASNTTRVHNENNRVSQNSQENFGSKSQTLLRDQITKLQRKMKRAFARLKIMENELSSLMKELDIEPESTRKTNSNEKVIYEQKQCIQTGGLVREDGELWFDSLNRKCECTGFKIRCY